MQNQLAVGVGGGLVFGVLLAVAISGTLADGKVERAIGQANEASGAAMSAATETLEARIATLETSLSESAAATNAAVDEKLAALQADVASQLAVVSEAVEAQASDLTALTEQMAQTSGASTGSASAVASLDMPTADARAVGETAVFADGAVRVFVSALDEDGQSARLSVNGTAHRLAAGASAPVTVDEADCVVALAGVTDAGAVIGFECGAEALQAAAADVPPAPEDGHSPGTTVSLADGSLRVFVSALAADGSSARLAVNGIETVTVQSGSSIDVTAGDQTCTLTVTGVGAGMVGLEGSCS